MRDHSTLTKAVPAIAAATYADDAAGLTIDRLGYDALTFALSLGVGGITFTATNRIDLILEHSEDGVAWEPVESENVPGDVAVAAGVVASIRTARPAATVQTVGYIDGTIADRRYVRLRADFNGTHGAGTPISAVALLGQPRHAPVA